MIDKKISMDEAKTLIKTLKQQRVMQDIFVAEVGLASWDEAVTVLPQFTENIHMYKVKEHAFKVRNLLIIHPDIRNLSTLVSLSGPKGSIAPKCEFCPSWS